MQWFKWFTPAFVAAALFVAFAPTAARADDTGSVSGTVVDSSGKGVPDASVRVTKPHEKGDKGAAAAAGGAATGEKKARPAPVAEGKTDADGKFNLTGIPVGDYVVFAGVKGVGRGMAKVTIAAGTPATCSITLQAGKGGKGAAGTGEKPAAPADAK